MSSDKSSQLIGNVNSDGTATLGADGTAFINLTDSRSNHFPTAASDILTSKSASESGNEEDYDSLQQTSTAVLQQATGDGLEEVSRGQKDNLAVRPAPTRLRSIPIVLDRLEEKGKYVLTADKNAIREILKMGLERVSHTLG